MSKGQHKPCRFPKCQTAGYADGLCKRHSNLNRSYDGLLLKALTLGVCPTEKWKRSDFAEAVALVGSNEQQPPPKAANHTDEDFSKPSLFGDKDLADISNEDLDRESLYQLARSRKIKADRDQMALDQSNGILVNRLEMIADCRQALEVCWSGISSLIDVLPGQIANSSPDVIRAVMIEHIERVGENLVAKLKELEA